MTDKTFTSRDLTDEVNRYFDTSGFRSHFDVPGIIDTIQRKHGTVSIDTLDETEFNRILDAHDISAVTPPAAAADSGARQGIIRDLYALAAFYTAHPDVPAPKHITLYHDVPDQVALNRLADELGERAYGGMASHVPANVRTLVYMHFVVADEL